VLFWMMFQDGHLRHSIRLSQGFNATEMTATGFVDSLTALPP